MAWKVIEAELTDWLESYEGPRFHGILSDPPYALISIAKRFAPGNAAAQEGADGRYSRLSSGFMGQRWDGFDSLEHYQDRVAEWAEQLIDRALYPGAVALFFGGTRTFHHLGVGLERGGFEIIDTVMWLHGQGFPKSHNIVEGYGTALKPAWEPIYLCRAPRDRNFKNLMAEYGTGGLNIDGSRIDAEDQSVLDAAVERMTDNEAVGWKNTSKAGIQPVSAQGRWPANLALSHTEDCVKVGEFEVEGRTINRFDQGMMPFGGAEGMEYESEKMPPDTVERWACVPECAVRLLDDAAGTLTSGKDSVRTKKLKSGIYGGGKGLEFEPTGNLEVFYGDKGGPSRFFYTAKASRSEKDLGLEEFYWQRVDEGFVRIERDKWERLDKKDRARGCIHPTVKPLELCRYLANLIKPPDGVESRLLVPFAGTGSEMIGALQAGWSEVEGIEMEANYVMSAEARIKANIGML